MKPRSRGPKSAENRLLAGQIPKTIGAGPRDCQTAKVRATSVVKSTIRWSFVPRMHEAVDRSGQSNIEIDVRLPPVIGTQCRCKVLETLTAQRAALKCAIARASAAARSAHSTRKWQRSIRPMRQCARIDPADGTVTIDVCAASPPVCHFVSVTGRIAYPTVLK